MKKLSFTLPKLKLSKTVVYVALAVVVLLAIVAYGAVRSVQAEKVQAAETARLEADAKRTAAAQRAYVDSLETQVEAGKTASQDSASICNWVDSMVASRRLTAAPPLCNKY